MAKSLSINWRQLGFEAAIIIVSVLAALALDDWRDARADRALEQHLLATLKDDLTADLEELNSSLESAVVVQRASSFLLGDADAYLAGEFGSAGLGRSRLIENSQRADEVSQEQAAISSMVGGIDFDLSDLTYQEMMSTGSFRIVRNGTLRRNAARYYWIIKSFYITNSTAESYRMGLANALLRNGVSPDRVDPQLLSKTLEDPEVRALIAQFGATARTLHEVHVTFISRAKHLLAEVDAEIAQ